MLLRRRIIKRALIALSVIVLASLSEEVGSNTQYSPQIEGLSDGVLQISYDQLPPIELKFDTLAVINPWSEETGYYFSAIGGGGIVGGDDSFYLVDNRNKEIVELGIDGKFKGILGKLGSGPGEFELPDHIGQLGMQVWVTDIQLKRVSVFSWDGILIRDFLWPLGIGWYVREFKVSSDGFIYCHDSWNRPVMAPEQNYYRLLRFDEKSTKADTVITIEADSYVPFILELPDRPPVPSEMQPVYSPKFRWSLWGDSIVTATTYEYQIEFRDRDGKIERLLKVVSTPFEVTDQDRRQWVRENYKNHWLGRAFTAWQLTPTRRFLEELPIAEYRPAVIDLEVDPLGRIWVLASTEDPGVDRMDLFNWDGDYIGGSTRLTIPRSFLRDGSPIYGVRIPGMGGGIQRIVILSMQ